MVTVLVFTLGVLIRLLSSLCHRPTLSCTHQRPWEQVLRQVAFVFGPVVQREQLTGSQPRRRVPRATMRRIRHQLHRALLSLDGPNYHSTGARQPGTLSGSHPQPSDARNTRT